MAVPVPVANRSDGVTLVTDPLHRLDTVTVMVPRPAWFWTLQMPRSFPVPLCASAMPAGDNTARTERMASVLFAAPAKTRLTVLIPRSPASSLHARCVRLPRGVPDPGQAVPDLPHLVSL